MVPTSHIRFNIMQRTDSFGYFVTLYTDCPVHGRAVVTNIEMQDIEPGEAIPESAWLQVDEEDLQKLGKYLVGQGLITAPVTEAERKAHDELKIKYEMQEKLLEQMRETLRDSNSRLDQIAGIMELTKTLQEKL